MKIFKLKRRFIKKLFRACITLFMCVSIFCCSVVAPVVSTPVRTEASPVVAVGKIASYILTALGALNIGTNGSISRVSGTLYDGLVERINDAMGQGVYVDSNGNYVFGNEFTNNVLSYLEGNADVGYRVISNFNPPSDFNGIWENSAYQTTEFINTWQYAKSLFPRYLSVGFFGDFNRFGYNRYLSTFAFFDLSNVAYIVLNGTTYQFYNSNNENISVREYMFACDYSYTDYSSYYGNGYNVISSSASSIEFGYASDTYINRLVDRYLIGDGGSPLLMSFLQFPFHGDFSYGISNSISLEIDSDRSIIICDSLLSGRQFGNKTSGIFVNNSTIPSVSETVINNNEWDSIYNSYVSNTNNYYTENNTNVTFDKDLLFESMTSNNKEIINAIEEGVENITDQFVTTNELLRKIYERMGVIQNLMDTSSSSSAVISGSSSAWSDIDVDTVLSDINNIKQLLQTNNSYLLGIPSRIDDCLDYLSSIDASLELVNNTLSNQAAVINYINTNTYNTNDKLERLYTLLNNVYQVLLSISSGGNNSPPLPVSSPYDDWFDVLHDMPEVELDNIITKWDVVKSLIEDTLPFVMLTLISVTLTNFVAQPQDPIFTIPVKLQNDFVDIDETITIDLTLFESILPMVRSLILIFWAICLILFWLWLLPKLIYIY